MGTSIFLEDLEFFGTHGVHASERERNQRFLISIIISGEIFKAMFTDKIEHTIDYSIVYQVVKNIVENRKFNLLETLAYSIVQAIFEKFDSACTITISVKKFPTSWTYKKYGSIGFKGTFSR